VRLLIVTPGYEPAWKYGGVIASNSTLARELVKRGVETTVYTTNASGEERFLDVPVGQPVDLGGVTVFYFRSAFGPKNTFYSRGLSRTLRDTIKGFDVVYVVALWQWMGIEAARLCAKWRIPMIVAIKGGFSQHLRSKSRMRKQLFRVLFLNRALRRATALHLSNESERADAGAWLQGFPVLYSPNAVDPARYYPRPADRSKFRAKWRIPQDAPVVISVGRPDWKKRIDLLIAGLVQAQAWRLVFVGDHSTGMAREWKLKADELGVSNRVVWTGFLSGEDLLSAFSAADLFALVSENENFGMAAVEAMMCGLPVMITRDVGVWQDIQDEPFTITVERRVDSVVAGLAGFERKVPLAPRDGSFIRESAISRYSPPNVAEHFLAQVSRVAPGLPLLSGAADSKERSLRLQFRVSSQRPPSLSNS
jgi:glycosyltransferase involved in cell wall biosynthesis